MKLIHAKGMQKVVVNGVVKRVPYLSGENSYAITPEQYRTGSFFYGYYRPVAEGAGRGAGAGRFRRPPQYPCPRYRGRPRPPFRPLRNPKRYAQPLLRALPGRLTLPGQRLLGPRQHQPAAP